MHSLPTGVSFFERGWLSSNNVLIQDEGQAILVDTGYWSHSAQTSSLVSSVLGNRSLTSVWNTHLHSDHCGGNAHLQAMFPDLQILIPPGHAPYVDNWDAEVLTYSPTGQHCPPFKRTGLLNDGDAHHIGGATWRIYSAPGHDPHSVVIFNEQEGVLISADALWENGFGVVFPEIEGVSAYDEVEATLKIIQQLQPKLVLPGHGGAFTDIPGALARAQTRLTQFRRAPDKHASYAAKVLLKFKLLELQRCTRTDFFNWAASTPYLRLLHTSYANGRSFEAWLLALCHSLQDAQACQLTDADIINLG